MANTLIGLLKGQTIQIDNHHRGVQNVWDSKYDIHLHKLSNNKNVDYDIKINLNHEPDENALSSLPAKIRKDIKKAASNKETLTNFYENVYMYLTENFSWNGDEEAEKKVMNNIAKAFGILPYKPLLQVVNGRTQKRNVIQMMRYDDGTRIHVSFNYSKECVYIGQFQLGSFSSINTETQQRWTDALERNLSDILAASDTKAALNRTRIRGISNKVIDRTLEAIERIYGDKPDATDKETE